VNLDVALGAAMAVLPGGLYALAVGVALIVLALRLRRERGLQDDLNREEAMNDHAARRHKRARGRRPTHHEPV
jgi:hypothetical protein